MEPDFSHTRAELATMIDGELGMYVRAITAEWWKLQDAIRGLSDLITQLHESSLQLQRWVQEVEPSSLPLEDHGEDQDHGHDQ